MESSQRDLNDMVVDTFIFKNNQITLSPCFTFIPKKMRDYLRISFNCELTQLRKSEIYPG